jgi:hypothetical protein
MFRLVFAITNQRDVSKGRLKVSQEMDVTCVLTTTYIDNASEMLYSLGMETESNEAY